VSKISEKELQETFSWERTNQYSTYSEILGHYQVLSVLENCKHGSLLDLACGDGFNTELMSRHFDYVVAVDASGIHLEKARKRLPSVIFHETLIEEYNPDERFDCVTMLNLLEHVEYPKVVLQKAASFLKDNGTLIVHVPNSNATNRKIAVLMGTLSSCDELSPFDINVAGHRRSYDMGLLKEEFENANLEIVCTGGVFYKMLSTPQMDWFLENGLWNDGGFGWGRIGSEQRDWKSEFCRACYEFGKEQPEDCNIIYVVAKKKN